MPLAVCANDGVALTTPSTGTYDVIYNAKSFNDTHGHWAAANIDFASARVLFSGVGNDTFDPNGTMTRAMFARVIANLEGVDLGAYTSSPFTDVETGAWYAPAAAWAADAGIVDGIGGDMFAPEQAVSREQMAVMLHNYISYKGYTFSGGAPATFADSGEISGWAEEAVGAIQRAGVVNGKPGNLYDPAGDATRAEVATIFRNFITNLAD
jgi:hypothetical protein